MDQSAIVTILMLIIAILLVVLALIIVMVLLHKQKHPEKSYVIATLNVVLTPLRILGVGPYKYGAITPEKVMKIMATELKLNDFGDMQFVASLRGVNSLPDFKAQRFSNLGYLVAMNEFKMGISRRLKMVDYLKNNASVLKVPISSPIFVFGLGRSGTTFLHRLLSLDPKARSPKLWELITPVPEVKDGAPLSMFEADREKRKEFIKKRVEERNVMGDDGLEKFHEVGHDLPEECLFALSDEMPTVFHYLYYTITNWHNLCRSGALNSADMVRAYQWYRKLLQLLSFQTGDIAGEQRWVLKCPLHIFMIPELGKVFPDAKIVWAHRHPKPTVSSLCSLLRAMRGIYFEKDDNDLHAFGKQMYTIAEKCLADAPKGIAESGLPCAHVLFENLVANPVEAVKAVYEQFNMEFTSEYESILLDYLEDNRKQREAMKVKLSKPGEKKEVLHDHQPENFGLSSQSLCEGVFGEYISNYNITSSK